MDPPAAEVSGFREVSPGKVVRESRGHTPQGSTTRGGGGVHFSVLSGIGALDHYKWGVPSGRGGRAKRETAVERSESRCMG